MQAIRCRESQFLRGDIARVDQSALDEVGDLMVHIWQSGKMRGLWELNCLPYGGTKIVAKEVTSQGDGTPQVKCCEDLESSASLEPN